MKYKLHIAYRNRLDLLVNAVASTRAIGNLNLWPNNGASNPGISGATVRPLPDMTATGVINMMIQSSWGDDVMFWAHNDVFCPGDTAARFLDRASRKFAEGDKWGVLFSHYDALCCFNMKMVRDVGYWDVFFPQYIADMDFYRRMRLKGWSEETYLYDEIEHRNVSSTIKADPLLNQQIQFGMGYCRDYYALKWGGAPGHEKFTTPFGG